MNVVGRRARVRVTGTVQGVGFRPYVYRLAGELSLGGFVLNAFLVGAQWNRFQHEPLFHEPVGG